ncbi:MAG: DUF3237 domain-containing protein [Actinomycetes bacterium]
MTEIEPPVLRWVGNAIVEVGKPLSVGRGPQGERRIVPVSGGRVTGAWDGVVQAGGADWQEVHTDGTTTLAARYPVMLSDGRTVCFVARGVRPAASVNGGFRTSLLVEGDTVDATSTTVYVAEGRKVDGAVEFDIFEVS